MDSFAGEQDIQLRPSPMRRLDSANDACPVVRLKVISSEQPVQEDGIPD